MTNNLTKYEEVKTIEEAEMSINLTHLIDGWKILVPPTPLIKAINMNGGMIFMQTGFWYILHKFHSTPSDE